jgi:hypothetical protein
MQTGGEHGSKGEVRPSVNKNAGLEDKIDDEKDKALAVATEEAPTDPKAAAST